MDANPETIIHTRGQTAMKDADRLIQDLLMFETEALTIEECPEEGVVTATLRLPSGECGTLTADYYAPHADRYKVNGERYQYMLDALTALGLTTNTVGSSTDGVPTPQVGNTVSHTNYGVGTVLRIIEEGGPITIYGDTLPNPSTLIGVLFEGTRVMVAVPPDRLALM